MTAITFEPTDLARLDDPYRALADLRRVAPIVRLRSGFWAVTGYEAAMEVFRHRSCASGPIAQRYVAAQPPGAARDATGRVKRGSADRDRCSTLRAPYARVIGRCAGARRSGGDARCGRPPLARSNARP